MTIIRRCSAICDIENCTTPSPPCRPAGVITDRAAVFLCLCRSCAAALDTYEHMYIVYLYTSYTFMCICYILICIFGRGAVYRGPRVKIQSVLDTVFYTAVAAVAVCVRELLRF